MNEEWRQVVGWEGLYEVSSHGHVRRIPTLRVLATRVHRSYPDVRLGSGGGSGGKRTSYFVHCLVAAAFLGPRPKGMDVDHLDGDKMNARAANLEYVTRKENLRRAWARLEPERTPIRREKYLARLAAKRTGRKPRGKAEEEFQPLSEEEKAFLRGSWRRQQDAAKQQPQSR